MKTTRFHIAERLGNAGITISLFAVFVGPFRGLTAESHRMDVPRPVAGTAALHIEGRGFDGTVPTRATCIIGTQNQADVHPVYPTVNGTNGSWTIINVAPGGWGLELYSPDFAFTRAANYRAVEVLFPGSIMTINSTNGPQGTLRRPLPIKVDQTTRLDFKLFRGATVTGRVLDADTGRPIAGVQVVGGPGDRSRDTTDARGSFAVKHLANEAAPIPDSPENADLGEVTVRVHSDIYVPACSQPVRVHEGQTVRGPAIQLRRGGWIAGKVVRPRDAPPEAVLDGSVQVELAGRMPEHYAVLGGRIERDGTFRIGPLLPGSYSLKAWLSSGKSTGVQSARRWRGVFPAVQVEVGKATGNIAIPVSRVEE